MPATEQHEIGDAIEIVFDGVVTATGAPAEPTATITVTEPDGTEVVYSGGGVTAPAAGRRQCVHPATKIGKHVAKLTGTSPSCAGTVRFVVVG